MKKQTLLLSFAFFTVFFFQCTNEDVAQQPVQETVTDADGNVYNTITMGNQVWMLENLKTTTFNDGTPITLYTFEEHGNNWGSLNNQISHYRWASTEDLNDVVDQELSFDYYGAMYNHFAIESGKLAPEGWRIPTKADFEALETYIANDGHAGNEATVLKTETGWLSSTGGGTNLYGFNALPNGYVSVPGTATAGQLICTWATSNYIPTEQRRVMISLFQPSNILYDENAIQIGAAIRCIKMQ